MNLSYEEILGRICNEKRLGKDEVEKQINEKIDKFSDLITKEGAAHIVANELGVKLIKDFEKKDVKINKLVAGLNNVNVVGKVVKLYDVRTFNKNDREGKVANFLIGDESGITKAVFWDTNHIREIEDGKIKEGTLLKLKNCYVKDNSGFTEIHLGNQGEISYKVDKDIEVNTGVNLVQKKKISELKEGGSALVHGHIVQVFEPRYYRACSECNKKVVEGNCPQHENAEIKDVPILNFYLDDGSDNIRIVAFRENADLILKNCEGHEDALGKFLAVQGRVVKNEMFDRIEMVSNSVKEVDYKDVMKDAI